MNTEEQSGKKAPDGLMENEQSAKLFQLHLEEYKALAHRSTALIGQMFTIMAIGFGYLGYLINNWQEWPADNRELLWPGLLVEQIIILFWLALRHTELGITVYISTHLREACEPDKNLCNLFWKYQAFSHSNAVPFTWLSMALPLLANMGAFIGVVIYRWMFLRGIPRSIWDWLSLATGAFLLLCTVIGSYKLMSLYKKLK